MSSKGAIPNGNHSKTRENRSGYRPAARIAAYVAVSLCVVYCVSVSLRLLCLLARVHVCVDNLCLAWHVSFINYYILRVESPLTNDKIIIISHSHALASASEIKFKIYNKIKITLKLFIYIYVHTDTDIMCLLPVYQYTASASVLYCMYAVCCVLCAVCTAIGVRVCVNIWRRHVPGATGATQGQRQRGHSHNTTHNAYV